MSIFRTGSDGDPIRQGGVAYPDEFGDREECPACLGEGGHYELDTDPSNGWYWVECMACLPYDDDDLLPPVESGYHLELKAEEN